MKVKELLELHRGSYGDDGVEINYGGETYNEERHGDLTVRYYYPDYDASTTIHDGIIVIKSKIVIVTEE